MNKKELWNYAIGRMLREDPFLGAVILQHKLVWSTEQSLTATIDGEQVVLNEDWWKKGDVALASARLRHLASHVALGHHIRRNGRKVDLWHKAGDLAINSLLFSGDPSVKCEKPEDMCLPGGKTTEWYYDALQSKEEQNEDSGNESDGENQGGDPSGEDDDQVDPSEQENDGEEQGQGDDEADTSDGENDSEDGEQDGTGSSGESGENDADESDSPGSGSEEQSQEVDEKDMGGPVDNDKSGSVYKWTMAMVNANTASSGLTAGWQKELIDRIMNPAPLNPKTLLRLYMTESSNTKNTYSRVNRRTAWRSDILMPGRFERSLGKVAVCVDTSGSVSSKELAWGLNAINEIIAAFPDTEVTVIEADTRVHMVTKYKGQQLPLGTTFHGRGGTTFNEALAVAQKEEATVVLYITDGWPSSWPAQEEVRVPVVWIMTRTGATAPWGRQINVPVA